MAKKYAGNTIWMRRYKIIIGTAGTGGLEVDQLHCIFEVNKSLSTKPNDSIVQIYNLSAQSRNAIIEEGSRVIIEAGYEGPQYGLIYDGDVIQTLRHAPDNVTEITEVISQDGDVFLNSGFINVSYSAGETSKSMLEQIAAKGGISVGAISENLSGTKLARGKAMFGQPKEFARRIAKTEQGLFYINDRKLCLTKAMDLPKDEIINLSPKTGLIGSPELTDDGLKGKSLLNPLINLDKLVFIDNSLVDNKSGKQLGDGVYKIFTLTHSGDTRGQEWYTSFVGVAQPGMFPLTGKSYQ